MCKLVLLFSSLSLILANEKYWDGDQIKEVELTSDDFGVNQGWKDHVEDSNDLDADGNYITGLEVSSNSTLHTLRKYRQVVSMIMAMQNGKIWDRYRRYGCWCFVNGRHSMESGSGSAVDEIDHTCMRFSKCYRCLAMDYENSFDENLSYNFDISVDQCECDPTTTVITCLDPKGTMKRSMCECDKELALKLSLFEDDWDPSFTENQGNFDRARVCAPGPNGNRVDECCGTYPKRYPYASGQGIKGCCGEKVYAREYFDCCTNNAIHRRGDCP